MARVKDYTNPDFHYGLERSVLSEWWVKDQQAALTWVNAQEPAQRKDLMRAILEVAGNRDPEGAWKLIQSLPASERPEGWAMSNLLYMWTHKDPQAALKAVLGETDAARIDATRRYERRRVADQQLVQLFLAVWRRISRAVHSLSGQGGLGIS